MPRAVLHLPSAVTSVAALLVTAVSLAACNAFLDDFEYVDASAPSVDGSAPGADATTAAPDATSDASGATEASAPPADAGSGDDGGDDDGGPSVAYRAAIVAAGPVAYWRLGESVGPQAFSIPGNGAYTATYTGLAELGVPGAIEGDPDTAVHIDGQTSAAASVVFDGVFATMNPQAFAIELWMRPMVAANASFDFVIKSSQLGNGMDLYYQESGGSALHGTQFLDGMTAYDNSSTDPFVGTWNYVVLQSDGVTLVLYLNARQVGTVAAIPPVDGGADAGPNLFAMGGDENGFSSFVGDIDEVAVYMMPLKPSTILRHYNLAGAHDAGM